MVRCLMVSSDVNIRLWCVRIRLTVAFTEDVDALLKRLRAAQS